MKIGSRIRDIVEKSWTEKKLTRDEIIELLKVPHNSIEGAFITYNANSMSRKALPKAEVHAQIGLNTSACPMNCEFCSFAAKNKIFSKAAEISADDACEITKSAEAKGANAIFVMATGDYSFERYLETARSIRKTLRKETPMVANVGDFDFETAKSLKEVGFCGIYHAIRMGEGSVTRLKVKDRLKTIENAKEAGLIVGTCVEPVGPEHSLEEIAEMTLIGREMEPCFSGSARRITIPGSNLEKHGMISEYRMAFIVAVVRLAMGALTPGNCTHEPNVPGALSGANLFWAEAGANPRDIEEETTKGRGTGVEYCRSLFVEAEYPVLKGPSIIYGKAK